MNILQKMRDAFFSNPRRLSIEREEGWYFGQESYSGQVVNDRSLLGLSTAWRCVSLISGTIASLPIRIYKEDKNGTPVIFKEHQLYSLLKSDPNYEQTAFDFWHFLASSIEVRGNA